MGEAIFLRTDGEARGSFSFGGIHIRQELLDADQLHHAGEYLHGQLQVLAGREGGGNADVAVVGILTVGEGSSRTGEDQAGLLAPGDDLLGAALHRVEGDEVAALGVGPAADAQAAQLLLQSILDDLKLGAEDIGVAAHMLHHAVDVLEEADVPQLIHLVVADGLDLHLGPDVRQVVLRGRQGRDAGAGEADLGGGGELVGQVRISCPLALRQDLDQVILVVVVEVVDGVGIVPVDAEVRSGGLQAGEPADGLIGVGNALGIAVLGDAPDALDGGILGYQLLHHVHIRAGGQHGHIDHLNAEVLGDGKVPVVAGNGAEELHLVQLAPGGRAHNALDHGPGHGVVHHVQAGVAIDDDLIRPDLHHVRHELLAFLNAVQHAVVPAVGAVLTGQVAVAVQHVHHTHGQIQLGLAGLAPGHIQGKLVALVLVVLLFQGCLQLQQLLPGQFGIGFHSYLRIRGICKISYINLHNTYIILWIAPKSNGQYPQILKEME